MNKAELISAVAQQSVSQRRITAAIDALISVVEDALSKQEKVVLVGFGTFEVKESRKKGPQSPDQGRNHDPCFKAPVFKAGKALKDKVN